MNITEHALMRYAQRFKNESISSDIVFKEWKKRNTDKVEEYEKSLRILFQGAEFLTEGIYDKNRKISSFYISEEDGICFVIDPKQQKIVTVYEINFGIGAHGNKVVLSEILKYIRDIKAEQDAFDKRRLEEQTALIREKKTLEIQKDEYREKMKEIETEQQKINKEIELSNTKSRSLTATLQNSYRKIIKSIEF